MVFILVRLEPSHSKQGSIRTYIYVSGILVPLSFFNIIQQYYYLTKNQENSRTSSFKEGALDASHNVAQEPISFYYGKVLIGGPFKAYWALGESLGPDTFVIKFSRDHQYL